MAVRKKKERAKGGEGKEEGAERGEGEKGGGGRRWGGGLDNERSLTVTHSNTYRTY